MRGLAHRLVTFEPDHENNPQTLQDYDMGRLEFQLQVQNFRGFVLQPTGVRMRDQARQLADVVSVEILGAKLGR